MLAGMESLNRHREFQASVARQMQDALDRAVAQVQTPGAVVRVGWIDTGPDGRSRHAHRAWVAGRRALQPEPEALDPDTVFDTASLTKGVITATLLAQLMHEAGIDPEALLARLLPQWKGNPRVRLRHLLTHTSGLPAGLPPGAAWQGEEGAIQAACTIAPTDEPDALFRYSDVNFILLGAVARRLGRQGLDELAGERILEPLRMRSSGFARLDGRPCPWPPQRVAPTEWEGEIGAGPHQGLPGGRMLRGVVHDPTARRMGGVAGHAGLFSSAADLDRYARMLLGRGEFDGVRVLAPEALDRMVSVATPKAMAEQRNLGWDVDTPLSRARGRQPRPGSFGHTGFTGCALWIDPPRRMFHLLLSNRVHPVARQSIVALYEEVATLAVQGLADAA